MALYKVEISNTGHTEFTVTAKNARITIDTQGRGITPLENFLASLGACMGFYIRLFFSKNNIPMRPFKIAIESRLTQERPYHFNAIDVTIALEDQTLDEATRRELVDFTRSCPLHATLAAVPEIKISLQ
jgi:uncharacterized OsmC-like protein